MLAAMWSIIHKGRYSKLQKASVKGTDKLFYYCLEYWSVAQPTERRTDNSEDVGLNPTTPTIYRDVAQFGRAPGLGPGCRRFKSCHPDHYIKKKGREFIMTDIKVLKIIARIPMLESRPKENGRIVQKLKRQYRQLTGKEYAAGDSETV